MIWGIIYHFSYLEIFLASDKSTAFYPFLKQKDTEVLWSLHPLTTPLIDLIPVTSELWESSRVTVFACSFLWCVLQHTHTQTNTLTPELHYFSATVMRLFLLSWPMASFWPNPFANSLIMPSLDHTTSLTWVTVFTAISHLALYGSVASSPFLSSLQPSLGTSLCWTYSSWKHSLGILFVAANLSLPHLLSLSQYGHWFSYNF